MGGFKNKRISYNCNSNAFSRLNLRFALFLTQNLPPSGSLSILTLFFPFLHLLFPVRMERIVIFIHMLVLEVYKRSCSLVYTRVLGGLGAVHVVRVSGVRFAWHSHPIRLFFSAFLCFYSDFIVYIHIVHSTCSSSLHTRMHL
ncbi:hypothetical protein DFS34DRAFT_608610 [Phlyctochytrium arcticum]|nr:hypothetical protein DFS34DRAFT_608610 [Phlyctochytrium arcticum]